MAIKVGAKAPSISLPDQDGKLHKLSDYLGQWILVYFYPRDNTPGCTIEACTIRDTFPKLEKLKAKVFGISTDSVASHKKFAERFKLPFTLLSDEQKVVVEKYGVWAEKSMLGRKYFGILRNSYLIDPQGKIAKIYEKVKPLSHAKEVLADLNELQK